MSASFPNNAILFDEAHSNGIIFKKDKIQIKEDVIKEQRELLFPIVKYMINPGYSDIEENMSVFDKTSAAISAVFSCISTLVNEKN